MAHNIDRLYIITGLGWLLFGISFGIWMGISGNLHFTNPHAHANLVGFVMPVLFGLTLRVFPQIRASRLIVPQFFIFQIGAFLVIVGKILVTLDHSDTLMVSVGSLVALAGTLMFAWIFITTPAGQAAG